MVKCEQSEEYSTNLTLLEEDHQVGNQAGKHFKFGFCKYKHKNQCNQEHIVAICNARNTCQTKKL